MSLIWNVSSNPDNVIKLAHSAQLVALGMTNTIIVYRDVADFIWSLAIVLTPILTLIALTWSRQRRATDAENFFWETGHQRLISSVGASVTVISVLKTFMNCISNNGVLLGPVVFAFKIAASAVSVLVCLGVYNKLTEKNRSVKNVLVAVIVFGVLRFS